MHLEAVGAERSQRVEGVDQPASFGGGLGVIPVGRRDGATGAGTSPYGVRDMLGNLSEWVADWYHPGYYAVAPRVDPQGPTEGESVEQCEPGPAMHALRGRCFADFAGSLRVYDRACALTWGFGRSFRCAVDAR